MAGRHGEQVDGKGVVEMLHVCGRAVVGQGDSGNHNAGANWWHRQCPSMPD